MSLGRWNVKIPSGLWMAGTIRCDNRREVTEFIAAWRKASPNVTADLVISYGRGETFAQTISFTDASGTARTAGESGHGCSEPSSAVIGAHQSQHAGDSRERPAITRIAA